MNPSKALDDDGPSPEVPWLQSSVFSTAALPVVGITNDHPRSSLRLYVCVGGGRRLKNCETYSVVLYHKRVTVEPLVHVKEDPRTGTVLHTSLQRTVPTEPSNKVQPPYRAQIKCTSKFNINSTCM